MRFELSVYGCVSTLLFSLSLVLQGSKWKSDKNKGLEKHLQV